MNTLENLNDYSNDDILYNGNATYSITFDPTSPVNQTTSVIEDLPFVSPVGTNITSMVNTPRDIEYTIDLSGVALPATIDWGTLPSFITSQIAGTNIFKLVGAIDETVWAQVKSPVITIIDQATTFTYPATITYPDPSDTANNLTKTWNVTVSITAVPNISSPTSTQYVSGIVGTLPGTPTITNTTAGTYSILITPSIANAVYTLASSGSGGTSVFDPVYKTLTLSGTKTEVNSHLASIQLTTVSNETRAFVLSYRLTNPSSGLVNTVTQNLTFTAAFDINTATYVEDTPFSLGYQVKDLSTTATNFTVSVAQTTPLANVSPGFFTVNGSNVGNTWTISNTRATINSANVIYTPPVDYTGTITLTVNQSRIDQSNSAVQVTNQPVNIINAGTNTEIENMIGRSYVSNNTNTLFPSQIPQITDGPDVGQTYTIQLSSSLGRIGNSAANAIASASYSFTGNKTACNAEFANIKFLPNTGVSSTGTFRYIQARASVTQYDQNLTLSGSIGALPDPVLVVASGVGTVTWTPSATQYLYGNFQILVVAGGGAMGNDASGNASPRGGGGGGGGGANFITLLAGNASSATHYLTVGNGGLESSDANVRRGSNSYITVNSSVIALATGGLGGNTRIANSFGANGGNSGTPVITSGTPFVTAVALSNTAYSGGIGTGSGANWGSGGGASAFGAGPQQGMPGTANVGGQGGEGYAVPIFGNGNPKFSAGGGGWGKTTNGRTGESGFKAGAGGGPPIPSGFAKFGMPGIIVIKVS